MKRNLAFLLLPAVLAGCGDGGAVPADTPEAKVTLAGNAWNVEIAHTPRQRFRGLSGRKHLRDGRGMLFVFPQAEPRIFCMRGCFIDIDIAFLDASRRVVAMHTMKAEPDRLGEVDYSSEVPAKYALEVSAGELEKAGVKIGDQAKFSGDIPPATE